MISITSKAVRDLVPGDMVDLEGDYYAAHCAAGEDCPDPAAHDVDQMVSEFEYAIVEGIERETPECIRVDFEDFTSVGFPPDHLLIVA